jgi:hypothetical protein
MLEVSSPQLYPQKCGNLGDFDVLGRLSMLESVTGKPSRKRLRVGAPGALTTRA